MTTKYPTFKEAFEAEILAPLGDDAASDYDIDALADTLLIDGTHDGVSFWGLASTSATGSCWRLRRTTCSDTHAPETPVSAPLL